MDSLKTERLRLLADADAEPWNQSTYFMMMGLTNIQGRQVSVKIFHQNKLSKEPSCYLHDLNETGRLHSSELQ